MVQVCKYSFSCSTCPQFIPSHCHCHLVKYSPVSGPDVLFHSKRRRKKKRRFYCRFFFFSPHGNFFTQPITHQFTEGCLYYIKGFFLTGSKHILFQVQIFFWYISYASLSSALQVGMPLTRAKFEFVFLSKMRVNYLCMVTSCRNGRILWRLVM